MSGLFGFVQGHTADRANKLINIMAHLLEPDQDRYHLASYCNQEVGLGSIKLKVLGSKPKIAWNESETICATFIGEIYNFTELNDELVSHGYQVPPKNNSELILRLFKIFDVSFAIKINGAFVVTIWDQEKHRLIIINDRLGLYPVYFAQTPNGFIFSTGIRAILADPDLDCTINLFSIAEFLTFDHILDDHTLLSNVKLLPQASILTFSENQILLNPFWKVQYPQIYQHRSQEDYLEELIDLLRKAIKRQLPDDLSAGLLLSGGLDSRFLLALLADENVHKPLHTFTWGVPGCDDVRIAQELARKTTTQHHFFELKPDYLLHKANEAVRLTDGMANIINLHALATLEEEAQHAQIIYKGFLGDAMMGFALQPPFWADYDEDTAEAVHLSVHKYQGVFYFDRAEQKNFFSKSFEQHVGNSVFETYHQGMQRANHHQLAVQRLYFDFTQRVPRHTLNGVKVVRSRAQVRLPFADNDFVDFSIRVPPGYQYKRQLMRLAFIQNYPNLAQTPISDTCLPMVSCSRDIILRTKQLLQWHVNNRVGNRVSWPVKRPYKDYNNWFRTILRSWVEDTLLSQKSLRRGYFNPEYVHQLVQNHMKGTDNTVQLGALLSLELWHQQFID